MAVRGLTFTKGTVLTRIDQVNRPTITDDKHGADWWNEDFGRMITFNFSELVKLIKTSVEFQTEFTVTNILSIITQANTSLQNVTTDKYPEEWWQTTFGLKVRQSFADELRLLQTDILTMRGSHGTGRG